MSEGALILALSHLDGVSLVRFFSLKKRNEHASLKRRFFCNSKCLHSRALGAAEGSFHFRRRKEMNKKLV